MTDDLGTVGERAALARILPRFVRAQALLGPGDDAAVLAAPDGRVVLSTDVMVQGPDFRLAWSTPEELGRKAVATNLADIAAMGARPTGLLVALTAPPATPIPFLEAFADGMAAACADLAPGMAAACADLAPGIGIVGGDLTSSPTLTIAVTAVGDLAGRAPVLRSGARPGDTIGYAGRLGLAAAGLRLLFAVGEADSAAIARLRAERPVLLREQLAPRPPIAAGPIAADAGATAMLDVSDGLLLDAGRIAAASGVLLDLDRAALEPDVTAVASASGLSPAEALAAVLSGGEDHGLLACFPGDVPPPFRAIGVVRTGVPAVLLDGAAVEGDAGWDSFASS